MSINVQNKILASLGLGMEDIDVDINFNDENEVDAAVAESALEMSQSVAAVEDSVEQANEVSDDVESLEAYVSLMQRNIRNGEGLDTVSNEMLNVGVTVITRKYGFNSQDILPSMESFGTSPYQNTVVSMEGISDTITKLLEGLKNLLTKIKNAIVNAWNKVRDFFRPVKVKLIQLKEKWKTRNSTITLDNGNKIFYKKPKLLDFAGRKKLKEVLADAKTALSTQAGFCIKIKDDYSVVMTKIAKARNKDELEKAKAEKAALDEKLKKQTEANTTSGGDDAKAEATVDSANDVQDSLDTAVEVANEVDKLDKENGKVKADGLDKTTKEIEAASTGDDELDKAKIEAAQEAAKAISEADAKALTMINDAAMLIKGMSDGLKDFVRETQVSKLGNESLEPAYRKFLKTRY